MLEQEELIASTRRDYENLTKEMTKIQVTMNTSLIFLLENFIKSRHDSGILTNFVLYLAVGE